MKTGAVARPRPVVLLHVRHGVAGMIAALRLVAMIAAVSTVLAARHVGAAVRDRGERAGREREGESGADELDLGHDILRLNRFVWGRFDVTRSAEGV